MGLVPSSLPLWAYLAAGGGAFVVARAATAGAGTDAGSGPASSGAPDPAAALANAQTAGSGPSLWDAFGGGGTNPINGLQGGQFGYPVAGGSSDPAGGGDSGGGDSGGTITPAPTPVPTPAPAPALTPYLWATFPPGKVDTYGTGKLGSGAACSLVNGNFTTGGFSAEVTKQTRYACDGSGARLELVIRSGQHAGKTVRYSQSSSVVTKYR